MESALLMIGFIAITNPKTLEEIQSMFQETKEVVALKREKALAYAFSQQFTSPHQKTTTISHSQPRHPYPNKNTTSSPFIQSSFPKREQKPCVVEKLPHSATSKSNYMTATASAKARIRSQSAPKARELSTPKEKYPGSAKQRACLFRCLIRQIAMRVPWFNDSNLRSPSFEGHSMSNYGNGAKYYALALFNASATVEKSKSKVTDEDLGGLESGGK
ncbi:hypothetical protein NC651_027780 [Populus alba x Populus x berolinensis]|nr:hypothetical protein NC651_027780 [Populus alba x Populus x berolinensis]